MTTTTSRLATIRYPSPTWFNNYEMIIAYDHTTTSQVYGIIAEYKRKYVFECVVKRTVPPMPRGIRWYLKNLRWRETGI